MIKKFKKFFQISKPLLNSQFNKVMISLLFFVILFSSVNAVTYLNSCGKETGWIDSETYILNFTQIKESELTSTNTCFYFDHIASLDITFQGYNQTIDNSNNRIFMFLYNNVHDGMTFKDFTLQSQGFGEFIRIQPDPNVIPEYVNLVNYEINNVKILDTGYFYRGISASTRYPYLYKGLITNTIFKGDTFIYGGVGNSGVRHNRIENSLIQTNFLFNGFVQITFAQNNTFTNSVAIYSNVDLEVLPAEYPFYSSLTNQYVSVDSNDDNIDDVGDPEHVNMKIYFDLFGYRFIQDGVEGEDFTHTNKILVPINDESLNSFPYYVFVTNENVTLDSSLSVQTYSQFGAMQLIDNNRIDCTYFSSQLSTNKCVMEEDIFFSTTSGNSNRPFIVMEDDTIVNHISFNKLGTSNANIIGTNDNLVTRNNIDITNNFLSKNDQRTLTRLDTSGNHIIKLRASNVFIYNNTFDLQGSGDIYEILEVQSTNPRSNSVILNQFNNNIGAITNKSEIFTTHCDTDFYNNYISNNVIVSDTCSSNLDVDVKVSYLHTDGKIYEYTIGNYYQENVGCVDGDSDGFCDSSYVSGSITDTKPLASWPFDYTAHLLTADNIIDTLDYNITLINITEGQVIEIADGTTPLIFTFQQNSDFDNLTCDFVFDGASVETVVDPAKNTNIDSSPLTSWINKTYTHRVECINSYIVDNEEFFNYQTSPEISFNITFTPAGNGGGNGGGNETPTNESDINEIIGLSIISSDPQETLDNVEEFNDTIVNPFLNFGIIILVFVAAFLIIGLIVALFSMI